MDEFERRIQDLYELDEEGIARMTREPSFSFIPLIDDDLAVVTAIRRIEAALNNDEKILVYGDYDTDGVMATSIMVRAFLLKGKTVSHFVPSRYRDGYGLTMDNAKKIAEAGYHLVILVDNGVSCLQEVSYLLSRGVETIIIDHHDLPPALPPSLALIHQDAISYGSVPVSAAYLCFLFSVAWLKNVDDYLLTLGAISLISDSMPIVDHNRDLVGLALRNIRKYGYPEIQLLSDTAYVDEFTLSMKVIPAINAVGRICEDHQLQRVVKYFAFRDEKENPVTANWMKEINLQRKSLTSRAQSEIRVNAEGSAVIVLCRLPEGLNGLLANKLLDVYEKPIAVLSEAKTDSSLYVGSLRSKEGFNVIDFQRYASRLLVKCGGHPYAGGFSIKKEDFRGFCDAFETYAFAHPLKPKAERFIPISLSEIDMDHYRILRKYGPFGLGHQEPLFLLKDLDVAGLLNSEDGRFLATPLGKNVRLFSFSYTRPEHYAIGEKVSLKGSFRMEEYRGRLRLQFLCEKA